MRHYGVDEAQSGIENRWLTNRQNRAGGHQGDADAEPPSHGLAQEQHRQDDRQRELGLSIGATRDAGASCKARNARAMTPRST